MPDIDISTAALRAGLALLGCSATTLWLDYFSLGGGLPLNDFVRLLGDGQAFPVEQFNRVAHALNELAEEAGLSRPVPYLDELNDPEWS